jgi:hypothetical protein
LTVIPRTTRRWRPKPRIPAPAGRFWWNCASPTANVLVAFANRFPPLGAYFFLVPVDPKSNNIRILVNRAQVVSIDRVTQAA